MNIFKGHITFFKAIIQFKNRMNRVERRRAKKAGIPVKKEPVVNIKAADVQGV